MCDVIEPNWLEMEEAIGDPDAAKQRTVDDIVEMHDAFLHRTVEACLLTNRELVRTLTKLLTTCLMFADQMKLFTEATRIVSIAFSSTLKSWVLHQILTGLTFFIEKNLTILARRKLAYRPGAPQCYPTQFE